MMTTPSYIIHRHLSHSSHTEKVRAVLAGQSRRDAGPSQWTDGHHDITRALLTLSCNLKLAELHIL